MDEIMKFAARQIVNNLLEQATVYLNEMGEFYPFGAAMDRKGNITPFSVYGGDEFPDSEKVIENLETALIRGCADNKWVFGGIGLDIFISYENRTDKVTALEIRILDSEETMAVYRYPYKKMNSGKYEFYEVV